MVAIAIFPARGGMLLVKYGLSNCAAEGISPCSPLSLAANSAERGCSRLSAAGLFRERRRRMLDQLAKGRSPAPLSSPLYRRVRVGSAGAAGHGCGHEAGDDRGQSSRLPAAASAAHAQDDTRGTSDREPEPVSSNQQEDGEGQSTESSSSAPHSEREREEGALPGFFRRVRQLGWSWLCFGISEKEKVWTVPWTGHTIFQVMFLWFSAFWLVGSWAVPMGAHALGFSRASMSSRAQALYSLVTDVAEMTVGLGILHRCLSRFYPLAPEWFPFHCRPRGPRHWAFDVMLGVLAFPVVNLLSQINLDLLPVSVPFQAASQLEQSLSARDPIATALYVIVVSVCAPVWEEVIFRGFLLPSLTRYLPVWASIIVSAVAFALAHFSLQRLLPLSFLGIVMGVVFVRSRNLFASMLLHSLWNGFVFLELLR